METVIIGAGAIGRWFAETVDIPATFVDVDASTARDAAAAVDGEVADPGTDRSFELVVIAVPMSVVTETIETYAPNATEAIVDLSGVMAEPVATMADVAPDRERASLHPLFAPVNAPGRIAVVTDHPGPIVETVSERLTAAGNTLFETTPDTHDQAMETIQARAHAAILAFALAAEEVPEPFGTPIYDELRELVADVTGGTPRVYADIQSTFSGAEDVASAAERIAEADQETFERLYREAGQLVR
ncbi:MAG: prephenate dehydrogenase [Halobacteriales archaeon]